MSKQSEQNTYIIPGKYQLLEEPIEINVGRKKTKIRVANTGDRPVQVGSHLHFIESNKELSFDRKSVVGMRLNIPAGTAKRFEPGEEMEVELTEIAGNREVYGLSNLTNGSVNNKDEIIKKAAELGFKGAES